MLRVMILDVKSWRDISFTINATNLKIVLLDISLTVKAAPHECVIRTGQPQT